MKTFLTTLLGFMIGFNSFSMNNLPPDSTNTLKERTLAKYLILEGKKIYNEGDFRKSLVQFRSALAKDKNNLTATYWVGECHIALGNYKKGLKYIELAYRMDADVNNDATYMMGLCNHKLGRIESALINYEIAKVILSKSRANLLSLDLRIGECKRVKGMMEKPIDVKITALGTGVNSKNDEYAPVVLNQGKTMYFSSRRPDNFGGGISEGDRKYFSDIYVSQWNEDINKWGVASNQNDTVKRLNSKGFDAISAFSSDGTLAYITINTDGLDKPKPKTKSVDIFTSEISSKGTWGKPKPMQKKTINTMYFEVSPTFTANGNTMYFVSERLGGKGKSDIWVTRKTGKSSWSKPENVDSVNTKHNETSVYITPDEKYMFFSSKGHKGIGGYDIYYAINTEGVWSKPKNIGYPINSVSDETHFQYYPEIGKAYYSKISIDGDGGAGGRDIFEIDISKLNLDK
jgi:tetratricopeptide (TPR) repeat protein